jgi:hypothetical protein
MFAALLIAVALSGAADPALHRIQAVTAFDGTWSGTGTLTQRRGRGTSCGPETTDRRFTIQGGQISWAYDNRYGVNFSGPIQANGSFDLASGNNRLQGQANGSDMTATYSSSECVRSFQMRRRRN